MGPLGVASDHHFNPRQDASLDFLYTAGDYQVDVFATIVGQKKPKLLYRLSFAVDDEQSAELIQIPTREMYLVWNSDTLSYDGHVRHESGKIFRAKAPAGIDRDEVVETLFMDAMLNREPDPHGDMPDDIE